MRCPAKGVECDCLDCELHRLQLAMSWQSPRAHVTLTGVIDVSIRRVVFTGPRTWGESIEQRQVARERVDHYGEQGYTIVQGGAKGLDSIVLAWCLSMGYRMETHYARWNEQGRKAGPIRNVKMLTQEGTEKVVAFRYKGRGWTRGTGHCVKTAEGFDLPVEIVEV